MSHILHFLLRLCLYQQASKFGRDLSSIQDPFRARLRNLTSAQFRHQVADLRLASVVETSEPSPWPSRPSRNRLIAVGLLALGLPIAPIETLAETFEFRLHGILLGQMTLHPPSPPSQDARNRQDLFWLEGKTRGPAHWFKDYEATFRSEAVAPNRVRYRVEAIDGGQPETRNIDYFPATEHIPLVNDFLDSTAASALTPDPKVDQGRIDPLAALQQMLGRVNSDRECAAEYRVYDGKRRYTVLSESTQTKPSRPKSTQPTVSDAQIRSTISCKITLGLQVSPSIDPARGAVQNPNSASDSGAGFWPFKKREQTMIIHFQRSVNGRFGFFGFDIHSPFGKIKGTKQLGA